MLRATLAWKEGNNRLAEGGEKIAYEERGFKLESWEWEGKRKSKKEELYKEKECKKMKRARAALSRWLSAQSMTDCQETEKKGFCFWGRYYGGNKSYISN